jgi:arylsulfatase A-like enzyme
VHYFDPHSPYLERPYFQPKPVAGAATIRTSNDEDTADRIRDYDSEIYYTDHYIGQVLDEVDRLGLKNSTLVVFTADHGESLGEHGYVGHGRQLYEGIVHTPLIMRLPGKIAAGKVIHTPVSAVDLTPTILDTVLGDKSRVSSSLYSGRSLAASLTGPYEPSPKRIYFVTFAGKKGSVPNWLSWVWVQDSELPLAFGHTDGSNKLVWRPDDGELRLNNVAKDPLELKPQKIKSNAQRYKVETAAMSEWFSNTQRRAEEAKLSERDREILKGLGYIQ